MTIPLSDRVAPGFVVQLTPEQRAEFPLETVVTRDRLGVMTASVHVSKADARSRVAHVIGVPYGSLADLAARVEEHFPRPPSDTSPE